MYYVSSVYSFTVPLYVLGLLVARHQEVTMYICDNWDMLYVLADSQLRGTPCTICCIYTLLPADVGQLASPKLVEV
jgi:hypothetical protein